VNIPKDRKEDLAKKDVYPKKKETFWVDPQLAERLATIPEGEKSFIFRMALRDYFGLTDSKNGVVGYQERSGS
jgi:hypothetical protein